MAFGSNYKREQELPVAMEGKHLVRIVNSREVFKNEWSALEVSFEYLDKVPRVPNKFVFFEPKPGADEKQIRAFNIRLTHFLDCFGLKPDFTDAGRMNWMQSVGTIELQKDENGYMSVTKFLPKDVAPDFSF